MDSIHAIRIAARQHKPIRQIARELSVSRNTVRKVLRGDATASAYHRQTQPRPKLAAFTSWLDQELTTDHAKPQKLRRTALTLYEGLQGQGYLGGYDAVRRYVQHWRTEQGSGVAHAFIPLTFAPGEAFQFDWSHEEVVLGGIRQTVKVAHVRLCFSRCFYLRAYLRESQEMVFDAHDRAFVFFGGTCQRGIYDNMKTAVEKVLRGKDRIWNARFLPLGSHYGFTPTACTPGAGWEKGQVENQVGTVRRRIFTLDRPCSDLADLNDWLEGQCRAEAKRLPHPEQPDRTVWEVFQKEQPLLVPTFGPFAGYQDRSARVSPTSLVTFDKNHYSVECRWVNRIVEVRGTADRVEIWTQGQRIGSHSRHFGTHQTLYDPWHYVPVLERKPGALRNGAPFQDWDLPGALARVREALKPFPDGDRQFVKILSAVALAGLDEVEQACDLTLTQGPVSADLVLTTLSHLRDDPKPEPLEVSALLALKEAPTTDCARYDGLRKEVTHETH